MIATLMAFNTSFGTAVTSSGGLFGNVSSSQPTGFGFGAGTGTSTTGIFGSNAPFGTSTGTAFGGFGAPAVSSQQTTGGLFNMPQTSTAFGFGMQPSTAPTTSSGGFFNFATPATSTGGLFGATQNTSMGGGFGNLGATNTGLGTTIGAAPAFGTTAGNLFGSGVNTNFQTQAPVDQTSALLMAMTMAVSQPVLFGDERDTVIAKWNQLQALWGVGKGYFNSEGSFVEFQPDNPYCLFKAIGYNCLPANKNEDGLIGLIFNKKVQDVESNQILIGDTLNKLFGGKPNVAVSIESVKAIPDDKTEMIIYVQERLTPGQSKRYPANEVFAYLAQANCRQLLVTQLGVENILLKTGLTQEQLKHYLNIPPAGIDSRIWQQAKLDNVDPDQFIPVPMIGFNELRNRLKYQEQQTQLHQTRLDVISQCLATLQRNHTNTMVKIEEHKRRHLELSHRVLKVIVKQEIHRKLGYAVHADEEQLRVQLENIQVQLNAPSQFRGRLNELTSQLRMQHYVVRPEVSYQINTVQQDIKQHLRQQQEGLQHLIDIIKDDLVDLKLIDKAHAEISSKR